MAAHAYSQEYLPGKETAWRREFIADQPRHDIRRPGGREGHDKAERAIGEGLREGWGGEQEPERQREKVRNPSPVRGRRWRGSAG